MNKLKSGADLSEYQHIKKILVADDDADMRSVLVELLESLNFTILEAFDGREAVEVLKKNRVDHVNTVDLLITDFKMPNLDGVQLLEWCRQNEFHMPVIFQSGQANLLKPEQIALADCCATLLLKPFNLESLLVAIRAADSKAHYRDCVHNRGTPV